MWLRILDVRKALEERTYAREGRIVLEVRDDFCQWNEDDTNWRAERKALNALVQTKRLTLLFPLPTWAQRTLTVWRSAHSNMRRGRKRHRLKQCNLRMRCSGHGGSPGGRIDCRI